MRVTIGPRGHRWGVLAIRREERRRFAWLFVREWPVLTLYWGPRVLSIGKMERIAHNHPAVSSAECPMCPR